MRIYKTPFEAFREVERDLWEMGIDVHPQTMQDKSVADDPDYLTKEVRAYAFQIFGWKWSPEAEFEAIQAICYDAQPGATNNPWVVQQYVQCEYDERFDADATPQNPGTSWSMRPELWREFLHCGKFAYTYSERTCLQLMRIGKELTERPDTRQAIITIHSNICPIPENHYLAGRVITSTDFKHMGASGGRVPCSMYYQFMVREDALDLIYTMRSCDFLTHFPVDVCIALRLQNIVAEALEVGVGMFTYFTGSLHAYAKDMKVRGIF